jgi:hypothetical protein
MAGATRSRGASRRARESIDGLIPHKRVDTLLNARDA